MKNSVSDLLAKLDMQRHTEAAVFSTQAAQDTRKRKD